MARMSSFQARKDLFRILSLGKDEFYLIITYSIIVGVLSLIVPIAAQGLVTIVSFGTIIQPLFILALAVFILLTGAAFFRILQTILVENIQQRIFVHLTLDLASILPRVRLSLYDDYRGTELMNRFFDIFTIQKTTAIIMLTGAGVFLQALFGLILLAAYHPLLLLFDLLLIIALCFSIWIPSSRGYQTALLESDAKYDVAAWLQEIARNATLFKFDGHAEHAYAKADSKIAEYIQARQGHFKQILRHVYSTHIIQVLASSSLLVLGGLLIISNQLTLGQLVAAEIVVTALGSSISKFGKYLETLYDLLAASKKVAFLLDLSVESESSENTDRRIHPPKIINAPQIKAENLSFIDNQQRKILTDINFVVEPLEHLAIYGGRGSGKSLLTEILVGLRESTSGNIFYNSIPVKEYTMEALRNKTAYIEGIAFFDGSILDNLIMNKESINMEKIRHTLEKYQLADTISQLSDGLYTQLYGNQHQLSSIELLKLMFVRATLAEPALLVIDEALDMMPESTLEIIMDAIFSPEYQWTIIATTRREHIAKLFDKVICL